jgi:endonuclease/exonuclease/phosphatase family metal-dependent hydrolase
VRVASFNVENLFERARALQLDWDEGRAILERYARINQLLNKPVYSDEDKSEIKELLRQLGLARSDDGGRYAELRQVRGRLLRRNPRLEIVATGRSSWIGWVELKTAPVDDLALEHTAKVIRDVAADVLGVVEAENRIALDRFSAQLLTKVQGQPYEHVMVIDGNDERGIDVGVMTRAGYEIASIRSHVDDTDAQGRVFSRDCPEFTVTTPMGQRLAVLVNHFKSKGNGRLSVTNALRKRQATRVAEIYQRLLDEGEKNIAVVGDLNDTPTSDPLSPLFAAGLKDVSEHPSFSDDGRPGTFKNGTTSQKLDYVLLSPALFSKVSGGAVFRTGVWGGKNGTLWPIYNTMTKPIHAASDHAAIYADINL